MKRSDLIRSIETAGCVSCGTAEIMTGIAIRKRVPVQPVPRHREASNELLARHILEKETAR